MKTKERRPKVVTSDELRKSSIKSAVKAAREALEEGFARRLALLGIFGDGKSVAREAVADQWSAQRDRPGVEAALARWKQQGYDDAGAVERFIREASYTWMNRLAAIRALEVRGLIRPIASLDENGNRPAIVTTLADVSPALYQAQEVAEALLWQQVFQELALQLGALFDPLDPHGLFPDSKAVLGALQAFTQLDETTWREDDTLGWLYQFFTTKDERAKLRKKKGAAFTPDDLGPINQFYTPGWIVRFLVDNTLGAMWRRMYPETKLGQFCTMLLPATDDDTPIALKRVRDVKIIDPACGAMHFGVYAFDVLRKMYAEEGIEPPREVPRLILEHNLAGIDIDRRAIQIAALNLYLKAAVALQEVGEHEPPRGLHLNLGCADAAPPTGEQQAKLRAQIVDPALREAVEVALSSLKYLHAVGSLLNVEADIRTAISQKTKPLPAGMSPLPGLLAQVGIAEDGEPTKLDALVTRAREVAETALRNDDVAGALVAEDAMLAANVLRLVNEHYDVVVMNPPYGPFMPPMTKQYILERYPQSKADIYGAFFELAFRLTEEHGAIGALTSKTFLYLDSFKHIRELLLQRRRLAALIDGGGGVLYESSVDACGAVAWNEAAHPESAAFVLRLVREADRENCMAAVIREVNLDRSFQHPVLYRPILAELLKLPTDTIAYWAPHAVLAAYQRYTPLEPAHGDVRTGLQTGNDEKLLRYWWEVPEEQIGRGKRWIPFAEGGDYSPYYDNMLRVVDWDDGRTEFRRLSNPNDYFREGITFPNVADRFHARFLPPGCIFSQVGIGIFGSESHALLGFLNTRVAQALLMAQSVTRHFEVGQVRRLCVPPLNSTTGDELANISRSALGAAERYAEGDERDRRFRKSWLERSDSRSFTTCAEHAVQERARFLSEQSDRQSQANEVLGAYMGFTTDDWQEIDRTFGPDIGEDKSLRVRGFREEPVDDPLLRASEHAKRYISAVINRILRNEKVVEAEYLFRKISDILIERFSEGNPLADFTMLNRKSLRDWLRLEYHLYHLQQHNSRPFIVRMNGPNRELLLFVDVLRSVSSDFRIAIAEPIELARRQAESIIAAARRDDETLRSQRIVEDAQDLARALNHAADDWDRQSGDGRHRVDRLKANADYLNEKAGTSGNPG